MAVATAPHPGLSRLNTLVRDFLRPPERLSVSQWADKYRTLSATHSSRPGPWETDFAPYLREMQDALGEPHVEEITIQASTQVGKTECILNMMAYVIDQDPGPTLMVMPREDDAVAMTTHRIKPMVELSPQLKRHVSSAKADWKLREITFDRMVLYMAGANSPADLASRPIRYLFRDELGKYPSFSGKEADPISLSSERTRTFWDRKIVDTSTPTIKGDYIDQRYELSDKRRFHVACPFCLKYQVLEFSLTTLRWPDGERDAEKIRRDHLAWYQCAYCNEAIPDDVQHKRRMLAGGKWVPKDCEIDREGNVRGPQDSRHRGYHINALYSPWLSWSDVAAKFLESKDDFSRLLNFYNSWLGLVWEEQAERSDPQLVARLAGNYAAGTVPKGCMLLTAGVDVQKDSLYYVIRGHGYNEESWLIEWGRVEEFESLESLLFRGTWEREGGGSPPLGVGLACVDSGYRTVEVYEFCRPYSPDRARPVKGFKELPGLPIRAAKIDRDYNGKVLGDGAMQLWHVHTSLFKDKIHRLMRLKTPEATLWHIPKDPSEEYLRHVTAEHKIKVRDRATGETKDEWKLRPGGGYANHWLDAEVYAMAAAEMLAVFAMRPEDAPAVEISRGDRMMPAMAPNAERRGWITGGRGGFGQRRGGSWFRGR